MPDMLTVESAAELVSRQSVKIDHRYEIPPVYIFQHSHWLQFVNDTDFPIKMFLKDAKESNDQFRCIDVLPRLPYFEKLPIGFLKASICGYFVVHLNGDVSDNMEPPTKDARVVEMALSVYTHPVALQRRWYGKINVQDKTHDEFTYGEDTYNFMKYGEVQPFYFSKEDIYFMVKAEMVTSWNSIYVIWRFLVQQFDPLNMEAKEVSSEKWKSCLCTIV